MSDDDGFRDAIDDAERSGGQKTIVGAGGLKVEKNDMNKVTTFGINFGQLKLTRFFCSTMQIVCLVIVDVLVEMACVCKACRASMEFVCHKHMKH